MSNYHKKDHRKKEEKQPTIPMLLDSELEAIAEKKRKRKEMMSGKVKR